MVREDGCARVHVCVCVRVSEGEENNGEILMKNNWLKGIFSIQVEVTNSQILLLLTRFPQVV